MYPAMLWTIGLTIALLIVIGIIVFLTRPCPVQPKTSSTEWCDLALARLQEPLSELGLVGFWIITPIDKLPNEPGSPKKLGFALSFFHPDCPLHRWTMPIHESMEYLDQDLVREFRELYEQNYGHHPTCLN